MLRYWNVLSDIGLNNNLSTGQAKRLQLVNRIGLLGGIIFVPYIFRYVEMGETGAAAIQAATTLGMWSLLLFNHFQRFLLGRYFLVLIASLNLLMTSGIFGFASGEHLGFMVLVMFISLMFDFKRELIHLMICLLFTVGIFTVLVLIDFHLLDGEVSISDQEQAESYLYNFGVTILISMLVGYYFQYFSHAEVNRIVARGRQQLKAAFDHSKAGILLVDTEDYSLIEFNQRAIRLLDWPEDPAVGMRLPDLPEGALPTKALVKAVMLTQNQIHPQEMAYSLPSGESVWLMLETQDFYYQGKALLHIQVIDMTQTKLYQQDLIKAKEIAQSANISRAHFLANMSHEFRTPINGIIGVADIVADEYAEDSLLQEYIGLLRESGERLLRTMSLVLDLAHLESGEHLVKRRWTDLKPVLVSLGSKLEPEIERKGLDFSLELPLQEQQAYVDPNLLHMALEHLLSNAVKFTSQGSIELCLRRETKLCKEVFIEIRDTGIGMSQAFIEEKLFMKFEQESGGLDRNFEGAGLGLSITKRIIDILDGRIEVHSEQGVGSTFRVYFPLFDRPETQFVTSKPYEPSQSIDR